ncbi:MAG: hypothetical protein VYA34_09135 [Myxococcota bacterium]|nr:hypothetical protein [Myxococcota bacterium]
MTFRSGDIHGFGKLCLEQNAEGGCLKALADSSLKNLNIKEGTRAQVDFLALGLSAVNDV